MARHWKEVASQTFDSDTLAEHKLVCVEHHFYSGAIRMARLIVVSKDGQPEQISMSGRFGGGKWARATAPARCNVEWTKAHVGRQFDRWLRKAKLTEAA